MADVIFVAVVVGFFALTAAYVKFCDRILGPDEAVLRPQPGGSVVNGALTEGSTAMQGADR